MFRLPLALAIFASAPAAPEPLVLKFGVYTSDKPSAMFASFQPIVDRISDEASRRLSRPVTIEMKVSKTYDQCQDALVGGQVDFVRFGPASYVLAQQKNRNVQLLAMEEENGRKRFKGVIIVRADSGITSLSELKGRSFAFGDPTSTVGRYLSQAELLKAGIHAKDLKSFEYLNRHDKVAKAVALGDFDAGAVMVSVFEKENEEGRLKVISSFDNVTKPWIAREGLPADVCEALRESLLSIRDREILKELKISGFVATSDADFELVREGMTLASEFEGTARPRAASSPSGNL